MNRVPFPAMFLGFAGLAPFLYGVLMIFSEAGTWPTLGVVESSPAGGLRMLERFGATILGFMGGCLWGFASAPGRAPTFLLLVASAAPAFLAVVAIREQPELSALWLAFGFVALQAIDVAFQRAGVAPEYWLSLRLPLTAGVMTFLLIGALYG